MNRRIFMQSVAAMAASAGYPAAYAQSAQKHSMVGIDSEGKPFNLESYAEKVCLVSFFTAGCNLCTHDLKLMREFYVSNHAKNFTLIGVNVDAKKEDFTEYSHLISMTIPADQRFPLIWRNAPQHADTFGPVTKQPTHFVLDGKQQQIFKREGTFQAEDWDRLWTKLAT